MQTVQSTGILATSPQLNGWTVFTLADQPLIGTNSRYCCYLWQRSSAHWLLDWSSSVHCRHCHKPDIASDGWHLNAATEEENKLGVLFHANVHATLRPFTLLKCSQNIELKLKKKTLHTQGFDYSVERINCFVDLAIDLKLRKDSQPSFQWTQGRILEEMITTAMSHGTDHFRKQWSETRMDFRGSSCYQ